MQVPKRLVWLAGLLVLGSLGPSVARAQDRVIAEGQEQKVMGLVSPYQLGEPVDEHWVLQNIAIERTVIRFQLTSSAAESDAEIVLHDGELDVDESVVVGSFRAVHTGPEESRAARVALISAVGRNDDETVWSRAVSDSTVTIDGVPELPMSTARTSPWAPVGLATLALGLCFAFLFRWSRRA